MRRQIVMLVAVLLLLQSLLAGFSAEAAEESRTRRKETDWEEYVEKIVPYYFHAMQKNDKEYYLSCEISTNLEDIAEKEIKVYLIKDESEALYLLEVYCVADRLQSSMVKIENELLDTVVKEGKPFCLNYVEDQIQVLSQSESSWLTEGAGELYTVQNERISLTKVVFSAKIVPDSNLRSSVSVALSVPFISNQNDPNGNGLCWAASCASIINYKTVHNFTALSLYNALHILYAQIQYGLPTGTPAWMQRAYSLGGLTYHYTNGRLYQESVLELLEANTPFLVALSYSSGGTTVGHGVVCRSYEETNGMIILGFMDPNYSGYKYSAPSEESCFPDDFSYYSTGHYWNWSYTIY